MPPMPKAWAALAKEKARDLTNFRRVALESLACLARLRHIIPVAEDPEFLKLELFFSHYRVPMIPRSLPLSLPRSIDDFRYDLEDIQGSMPEIMYKVAHDKLGYSFKDRDLTGRAAMADAQLVTDGANVLRSGAASYYQTQGASVGEFNILCLVEDRLPLTY